MFIVFPGLRCHDSVQFPSQVGGWAGLIAPLSIHWKLVIHFENVCTLLFLPSQMSADVQFDFPVELKMEQVDQPPH